MHLQADLQRAVGLAGPRGPYCFGDQLWFQILGGRLYVQFQTTNKALASGSTRAADGWFPANQGAGECH